jgi:hypothetical protein
MENFADSEVLVLRNPFDREFTFSYDTSRGGPTVVFAPREEKPLPKVLAMYGAQKMAHKLVSVGKYSNTLNKKLMMDTINGLVRPLSLSSLESSASRVEIETEENPESDLTEEKDVDRLKEPEEGGFEGVNEEEVVYDEEEERKAIVKENNPKQYRTEELDNEFSRNELMKMANKAKLDTNSSMKKEDLIELIVQYEIAEGILQF